jgi:hypothetical protein
MRLEYDLDAIVLLLYEHREALGSIFEPHPVRNDETGIDFSSLNPVEQRTHVPLYVALPSPDR